MFKAAMLVAVSFSGTSQSTYTIPGYESLDSCIRSQKSVMQQIMTEPFTRDTGKLKHRATLPRYVETKCIETMTAHSPR